MKVYNEISLRDFEFWSGAKENAEELTDCQLDKVEAILEDLYPDGVDETTINDLFGLILTLSASGLESKKRRHSMSL